MALTTRLLALRKSPLLLRLPPYLSALCLVIGICWLLILPLNEYSRNTYISENAILPGQVHTYFGGSEHNVFRAYRQEVYRLSQQDYHARVSGLEQMVQEVGLKSAKQEYEWKVAGESINGTNVYGLLVGPRADATEAMVLIAAWRNFEGKINYSGVALAFSLMRYFKRWSIWSKDIVLLIPEDSTYGPEAWVSAYHSTAPAISSSKNISALPLKSGALQGAVALDYPAGPWGQRFDKLDIVYDGINGALPNLDLLNTAISVANSQMGIGCTFHGLSNHKDTYTDRLYTIARGLLTQSVGHATGPHSAFMPYHVDAITLKTVGDGWHDEMSLGRTTESLMRSINNLLEHLHQSFFFYILLNPIRFVSIGNYLPAAMILAGSFTIMALAKWAESGQLAATDEEKESARSTTRKSKLSTSKHEVIQEGGDIALVPTAMARVGERNLFLPVVLVLGIHLTGLVPLYLINNLPRDLLPFATTILMLLNPFYTLALARLLSSEMTSSTTCLTQALSLLLLSAIYSTLATLNFSLAFLLALASSPLPFLRPLPAPASRAEHKTAAEHRENMRRFCLWLAVSLLYVVVSPPVVLWMLVRQVFGWGLSAAALEMARGWVAQAVWVGAVVWGVWWPGWVLGGVVLWAGCF